jgi:hypothetical protein
MEVYPLRVPDLEERAGRGEARAIARGRSTIAEVLERGRLAMLEEDQAEEYARDPVAFVRAHRPRTRLIDRLLFGKGTR